MEIENREMKIVVIQKVSNYLSTPVTGVKLLSFCNSNPRAVDAFEAEKRCTEAEKNSAIERCEGASLQRIRRKRWEYENIHKGIAV